MAFPPLGDIATKCHLGSRQCPHQKVQPVDVLILDFLTLQNYGKYNFDIYKFSNLGYYSTNRLRHYIPHS